jgi:hypothetical protein
LNVWFEAETVKVCEIWFGVRMHSKLSDVFWIAGVFLFYIVIVIIVDLGLYLLLLVAKCSYLFCIFLLVVWNVLFCMMLVFFIYA